MDNLESPIIFVCFFFKLKSLFLGKSPLIFLRVTVIHSLIIFINSLNIIVKLLFTRYYAKISKYKNEKTISLPSRLIVQTDMQTTQYIMLIVIMGKWEKCSEA